MTRRQFLTHPPVGFVEPWRRYLQANATIPQATGRRAHGAAHAVRQPVARKPRRQDLLPDRRRAAPHADAEWPTAGRARASAADNTFLRAVPDTRSRTTSKTRSSPRLGDLVLCQREIAPKRAPGRCRRYSSTFHHRRSIHAYENARLKSTPTGPLPLSAKRKCYGAACGKQTEQDLREERESARPVSHAGP